MPNAVNGGRPPRNSPKRSARIRPGDTRACPPAGLPNLLDVPGRSLADQLRELQFCRQRLEDITSRFQKDQPDVLPPADRVLLPKGTISVDAARPVPAVIDHQGRPAGVRQEIAGADRTRVQRPVQRLRQLREHAGNLQQTIEDQAKAFLSDRFANEGVDQMFFSRFTSTTTAAEAIAHLYEQATPPLKLMASERIETIVLGGPGGDTGKQLLHLGEYALPAPPSAYVTLADEVVVYREYSRIPLTALPQLGTVGEEAYNDALDAQGGTPHSRIDVPTWQDVEVGS